MNINGGLMMDNVTIQKHYSIGSIMERITEALKKSGKDLDNLKPDDLAPVDAFHTRGKDATLELVELAQFKEGDKVLDVGCGLGGSARFIADNYGCNVTGIDLTQDYIDVANELNKLVGLQDKVTCQQASALALPFEDDTFDIVWTEHVQMNIPDKEMFYSEIARVLKPGGRFVCHEILQGSGGSINVPVPWAEEAHMSALGTSEELKSAIQKTELKIQKWIDKSDVSLDFFKSVVEKFKESGPPPLGIHLLMGDTAKQKLRNYITNLTENRTAVAQCMAVK
jgi:ubiquinone/menaquinone biosynthesis C-methylase UbiE